MPDKGTKRDHLDDLWEELVRTREAIRTLHKANEELRVKLAIAQAEIDGYVKRHDADRRIITELGERMRRLAYGRG
jgi:molecular chaperone GrpE (heat shock protein)